ncbi:MAG: UDP-glucose/GDP-mannose dehydrogenase family protein [Patescibacteria group bacterium]|nr:UDP-glucose/GDP-mannose dehydrogenase family protein [Patescibacteria group bacterium]
MTLTVVGHGYVGLVTACVFADFGNTVYVIGRNEKKINELRKGNPLIYEPGLKEILQRNLQAKRIFFRLDYTSVSQSEIVFIAVGTPPKENGEADLSGVFEVSEKIAKNLSKKNDHFTVISCKSTVPVGTNKQIEKIIKNHTPKRVNFAVASCPEFLREGSAISDTLNADRVVIGSESKKAIEILLELHKPIEGKKIVTDLSSAELIKYTANAMLATKVSFANFISFFCEKTGADIETVLDAVGLDKRIGRVFMSPGVGFGGSCLPKDVMALISTGKKLNIDVSFLEAVVKINSQAKKNFLKKILSNHQGKNLAIWGLAFKPNTDDIRFAPSLFIIEKLLENDFQLTVYDQQALLNVKKIFKDKIRYTKDPYQAIKEKDGLVILTEWNEFRQVDLNRVRSLLKKPVIFDGRNLYQISTMKKLGFYYYSVGRS